MNRMGGKGPSQNPMRRGGGPMFARPKEKPRNLKESIKRLMYYISMNKKLFYSTLVIVLVSTLISLYCNVLVKDVVTSLGTLNENLVFVVNPDRSLFVKSIVLLLILYVVHAVFQYLSSIFGALLSIRTIRAMRNDLFKKIVYLPIGYVDSHPHGDIMSRMSNDVDNVANAISSTISSLISGVLTILGCLVIMIYYSPLLTLVSCLVLSMTLLLSLFMSKVARPMFIKQQVILGNLNSQTEEMVTGYRTVVTYNRQHQAIIDFNTQSDMLAKEGMKASIIAGSMGPVMNFIGNVGYFLVCLFGSIFITKKIGGPIYDWSGLDVATVIVFLTLTKQFSRPINQIAQLYSSFISALAGAERVFAILDEKSEDFSFTEEYKVEDVKGDIEFENIEFSYIPGKKVLRDFTVDIKRGHKVALVGATGSGKTTITNLLLRFYDVDSGSIKIDGIDIAKISKKDLRDSISIVLQDPVLFKDTIENNVRYSKANATDEEIDAALRFANCHTFVDKLPLGKKTLLTEGATNISLGQRQLITIARAVLANPKILILDEATSSVDTRTEKNIQDAMVRLMSDRTSIIIAHRISTIEDADLIVVLDNGRVVEMGNHQELIDLDGHYNKLYQTQFKGLNT